MTENIQIKIAQLHNCEINIIKHDVKKNELTLKLMCQNIKHEA
jgi:hypothetical protein